MSIPFVSAIPPAAQKLQILTRAFRAGEAVGGNAVARPGAAEPSAPGRATCYGGNGP